MLLRNKKVYFQSFIFFLRKRQKEISNESIKICFYLEKNKFNSKKFSITIIKLDYIPCS